jgi:hypothetical protein
MTAPRHADSGVLAGFDTSKANIARVCDYWLGRKVDILRTLAGRKPSTPYVPCVTTWQSPRGI